MNKLRAAILVLILCVATQFCAGMVASAATAATPTPQVQDSTITVTDLQGPSVTEALAHRARDSWPWYVARASGMIAAACLVILMLSGVGQITGQTYRFLEPLTAWATHRALGITLLISTIIHMSSLLFDSYIPFNILEILVPWLSDYKPVTLFGMSVGSLYIALGVLAFYGLAAIVLTSVVWIEKKPYLWKWFHLLSYMVIVFVYVHALYLGTDISHGFYRTAWLVAGAAVGIAVLLRLWRARTI